MFFFFRELPKQTNENFLTTKKSPMRQQKQRQEQLFFFPLQLSPPVLLKVQTPTVKQ
jgi:hypothetical protein